MKMLSTKISVNDVGQQERGRDGRLGDRLAVGGRPCSNASGVSELRRASRRAAASRSSEVAQQHLELCSWADCRCAARRAAGRHPAARSTRWTSGSAGHVGGHEVVARSADPPASSALGLGAVDQHDVRRERRARPRRHRSTR